MTTPLRRSELAVPAANEHMFAKAAACGADLVFLDLEDATPVALKERSRELAVSALTELDWGRTARAIRINGLDTEWCHDDIIEVVTRAGRDLDTIVVPKARTARDVWWVDVLLTQLETKLGLSRPIRLEVLIEEVEGLANAEAIAAASPRVDALIFGVGDFSLSQGARVDTNFVPLGDYPGDFWHYARAKVIVAARIAGVLAIDAPYPDYGDLAGYERDARRASLLGYSGKWAIHPSQIEVANTVYSPTPEEIALAQRNLAAYRAAEADGRGAVGVDGVLVDAAHVKMAMATLARAAQIDPDRYGKAISA
ncbi:HpcH/HpaI aldolase/citrate lyase family protein [Nocardia sp. NPDC004068]|uniref:HpcH/HpaI aldolase/citrate lyase family protein n=1 Tax=Nocardia sp. NPDC004068 TaxID=3364303 RepID=UPI0036A0394E